MSRIAYACLWLFCFTVPWEASVMIPGLGTGPTGEGTAGKLVGLVTAVVGVLAVLTRGRVRPLATFHIVAGLFVIWAGITSAWSIDPGFSVMTFKVGVQLLAVPWLIWELAATPRLRRNLFQAYVFGAYVSVLNILAHYKEGVGAKGDVLVEGAATGRFTAEGFNPNEIGFLLVLALPIAWQLGFEQRHAIIRWINQLYLPLGTIAILLTGSRSSLIGAILALTIVPLTLRRLTLGPRVAVFALILATLVAGALVVPQKTLERLATTKDEIESGTLNDRRLIWQAGLEVFLHRPVGGIGAGGFPTAVKPFLGYKKTAHNTYLSVLVEQGVIGLALFLLMFVSVYFHARSVAPEERRFLLVILFSILIGLIPRGWEFGKPLWLMFGLMLAPSATYALAHPAVQWIRRAPPRPVRQAAVRRSAGPRR